MDPQNWPDLVYTYGPYALLPLLLLWVAPRQTKQFLACKKSERAKQVLCGAVAAACWAAGFVAVGYVVLRWPPRQVYAGDLGIHKEPAKFIPVDPGFFVQRTALAAGGGGRSNWSYLVVTDNPAENREFWFTLQWDKGPEDYTDCVMPLSLLKARKIDFRADGDRPGVLLYDHDADPATPPEPFDCESPAPSTAASGGAIFAIGSAHAQAPAPAPAPLQSRMSEDRLVSWLNSPDPYWRAQGRRQLRGYGPQELRRLLERDDLGDAARRQIQRELARRG